MSFRLVEMCQNLLWVQIVEIWIFFKLEIFFFLLLVILFLISSDLDSWIVDRTKSLSMSSPLFWARRTFQVRDIQFDRSILKWSLSSHSFRVDWERILEHGTCERNDDKRTKLSGEEFSSHCQCVKIQLYRNEIVENYVEKDHMFKLYYIVYNYIPWSQ